jgi:hypothetical protein
MKLKKSAQFLRKALSILWAVSFITLFLATPLLHNHPHSIKEHSDCPAYILQLSLQSNSIEHKSAEQDFTEIIQYLDPTGHVTWFDEFYGQITPYRGPPAG